MRVCTHLLRLELSIRHVPSSRTQWPKTAGMEGTVLFGSKTAPSGKLSIQKIPAEPESRGLWGLVKLANPLGVSGEARRWRVRQLRKNVPQLLRLAIVLAVMNVTRAIFGPQLLVGHSSLVLWVKRADGEMVPLGLAGTKVVTDNGVAAIVDGLDTGTMAAFDYAGIGTTNTAEAASDSDLIAEITTQYNTDNTRPTGTISQPSANIFQNLATIGVDGSVAAVEHGIFDNATVGSGTLLDRTVFSTVNLSSGDSLQATYQLTLTAGS